MTDNERTKPIRVTNNDEATLRLGVIWISNRDAEWIRKDCRFNKLNVVLRACGSESELPNLDVIANSAWFRNWITIFAHSLQVDLDGLSDSLFGLFHRSSCGHTAWQVGHISRTIAIASFNDDSVFHRVHFKPACLRMLLSVLG